MDFKYRNDQEYTAREMTNENIFRTVEYLFFFFFSFSWWILQILHSGKAYESSILFSREVEGKFSGEDMSLKLEAGAGLNS